MSSMNESSSIDLRTSGVRITDHGFSRTNDSILYQSRDCKEFFTDSELFEDPDYFTSIELAKKQIDRLSMKLEDCLSVLASQKPQKKLRSMTHKPAELGKGIPGEIMICSIECRLSELYQFKEELNKFIKKVESDFFYTGKISFGKLNLDLKVKQRDSPFINKNQIFKEFKTLNEAKDQSPGKFEKEKYLEAFKELEAKMGRSYDEEGCDMVFIRKRDSKDERKLKFVSGLETQLIKTYKAEEDAKLRELEWQIMSVNIKKSFYHKELEKLAGREQDLMRISKQISEDTVKNAKERERLEEDAYEIEQTKYHNEKLFNKKIEYITEVLQLLEDSNIEGLPDLIQTDSKSPTKTTDEIMQLEKQLKELEYDYRHSKRPESLESLQTNINRLKSSILNLKSLNAMQKTEKTSSALRQNMNRMDKKLDNSLEGMNNRNPFVSSNSDTSLKVGKILPHHPLPASIRISPLRKLEITTPVLNINQLNTPSRKSPLRVPESPKNDAILGKQLRIKEQLLREREEELEEEEKRLQDVWMDVPEGEQMMPILQNEIAEYRKKKNEVIRLKEGLEKEKSEWRDKLSHIQKKEEKIKQEKIKFEMLRRPVNEKLEWLKKMLIEDL